jgi:hypothetical protein
LCKDVAPLDSRKVPDMEEARKRLSSLEEENLDLRAEVDEILDEMATLEQRLISVKSIITRVCDELYV